MGNGRAGVGERDAVEDVETRGQDDVRRNRGTYGLEDFASQPGAILETATVVSGAVSCAE